MKISELLSTVSINLDAHAQDKPSAIKEAVKLINKSGAINDVETYENGVFARESKMSTGIGEGIAIPHCKSKAVTKPALAAMVFKDGGVDFQSIDGEKVTLLFLIAAPDTEDNVHLEALAKLSNVLMHPEFTFALKMAKSPETFLNILDYAEATVDLEHKHNVISKYPRLLAVTGCPTGIAHTYMAQEALEKAAKERGITIKVETNGSGGIKNQLTDEEIEHAEGIIIAADISVEMARFNGKRLIQVPVTRGINTPLELIDMALDPITSIYHTDRKPTKQDKAQQGSKGQIIYRHLMSGISHMIPFVVAGGILLAIAYLIDALSGVSREATNFGTVTVGAQIFHMLGGDLGLGLMFPILAGFIAYSIAGRAGLVSGFVGGFAASKGSFSLLYLLEYVKDPESKIVEQLGSTAAGFLGAIVAGFLAGYIVVLLRHLFKKAPKNLAGVIDMLVLPLLSTAVVGLSMLLINVPFAYVNIGICNGINALADAKLTIIVGFLISALMAIDMGGPINKATHYAALAILTSYEMKSYGLWVMASNIVGIMTPPIGIALATWLFPQKFEKEDRRTSLANIFTGCCGITEGAIPFVVKDPVRVIVSTFTGAGIGGMICMSLEGQAIAPEGGLISMAVMGEPFWKGLIATIIGSLVTCFLLGFLKKDVKEDKAGLGKWKGIPTQPVYNLFAKVGNGIAGKVKSLKKEKKDEVQENSDQN